MLFKRNFIFKQINKMQNYLHMLYLRIFGDGIEAINMNLFLGRILGIPIPSPSIIVNVNISCEKIDTNMLNYLFVLHCIIFSTFLLFNCEHLIR